MKPLFVLLVFGLTLGGPLPAQAQTTLLNVSYDPTRELYRRSTKRSPSTGPRNPVDRK